jgi:hypothetical protein
LVAGGIPPQKSDLTRFYEASVVISGYSAPNTQHLLLYLAWEPSNVLGSANMDFEVNKVATPWLDSPPPFPIDCTINRSNGDILVTYDFTGGGGTPTIGLRTWNRSSWPHRPATTSTTRPRTPSTSARTRRARRKRGHVLRDRHAADRRSRERNVTGVGRHAVEDHLCQREQCRHRQFATGLR